MALKRSLSASLRLCARTLYPDECISINPHTNPEAPSVSMPRKICCTVANITDHGERVYTVDLTPASQAPRFRPGQFLHLTVDDYDPSGFWPDSRVFSIASSPRDCRQIRICYSVKGRYTAKMEQQLAVGASVWIKLPYGEFMIDETRDAVLIAGGTGISAFTAFIEALTPAYQRRVTLLYGARSPSLFLFGDMLQAQSAAVPGLDVILFAEKAAALPCIAGRISLGHIWERLSDPADQVFYLSGPPVMRDALAADLKARAIPADSIRTDAWE
jgi:ferredoxin-NADP reductase